LRPAAPKSKRDGRRGEGESGKSGINLVKEMQDGKCKGRWTTFQIKAATTGGKSEEK
jgi:hypothetical protein